MSTPLQTGDDLTSQIRWIVVQLENGGALVPVSSNRADDRGHETRAGLTWRTYSEDYLRLPAGQRCPLADFQALSLDEIVTVIAEVFALRTNLWPIRDPRLRLAVVDFAIHSGPHDAIGALQRAAGLPPDGICGPETLARVNAANADVLREGVMDARYQKAGRIVLADRDQLANLAGWLARFGRVLRWRAGGTA